MDDPVTPADPLYVYLVERRTRPKRQRTRFECWETVAAFLTLAEAEACRANLPAAIYGARVERVLAAGELAAILAAKPALMFGAYTMTG